MTFICFFPEGVRDKMDKSEEETLRRPTLGFPCVAAERNAHCAMRVDICGAME